MFPRNGRFTLDFRRAFASIVAVAVTQGASRCLRPQVGCLFSELSLVMPSLHFFRFLSQLAFRASRLSDVEGDREAGNPELRPLSILSWRNSVRRDELGEEEAVESYKTRVMGHVLLACLMFGTIAGSGSVARSEEPASKETMDRKQTMGWIAVGGGGVLLGAFGYSHYRVSSINQDEGVVAYRNGVTGDICDAADAGVVSDTPGAASPGEVQSNCTSARRWERLQLVFLPLGLVSMGAGIYLLSSEPSTKTKSAAGVRVAPTLHSRGAAVQVRGSF